MSLTTKILKIFLFIFLAQLGLLGLWSISLFNSKNDQYPNPVITSLTKVDNSILEGIILQNKVGSPLARDLIIYKLLELNNVDSAEFLNKAPIEKIIDSLKLSNCINRKDIFICSRINNKIALSLIPLRIDDTIEGYLKLEKSLIFNDEVNKKILKTIIITVLIVFLLNAFTLIIIWWMFLRPETMKLIRVFETETQDSGIEIKEFRIIQDGFLSAISRVKSSESEKALMVSELEKISLASQVAHDIRSPLEMLKGIKEDLALLPQDSRRRIMLGINRIEEISFNLLRANKDDLILNNETISQELLSLVLSVITEKKIEFKKNEKVDIFDKFASNSYGLFSKLNRNKIKSIISNIINNSIQAMGENSGTVEIYLDSLSHHNVIRIKDDGSGMSPEVSSKIFTKGFTTKEAGNGIGLANAKLDIEALGGTLTFETELGKGTTFFITLPKSEKSSTFIGAINASKYDKIIVLDDDPAFHDVWSNRLKGLESKTEHIFSVQDMLLKYSGLDSKTLLLTDFELMDKEFDGLDVIQKLNHSKDSILVTARSEENDIQDRCTKAGVKLLSKSLVNYIEIISDKVQTNIPQIVLIDDDKMIQIDWFYYCEKESIPFKGFRSVEKFLEIAHTLDKETIIFIDSNLGHDIKGEVESEKIFNLGFKNIYLATGYQKEDIKKPHWIIDIFSKSPDSIKRTIA